jgi:hypothetical protein
MPLPRSAPHRLHEIQLGLIVVSIELRLSLFPLWENPQMCGRYRLSAEADHRRVFRDCSVNHDKKCSRPVVIADTQNRLFA